MAYSGPTFVEKSDYVAYQQSQFDKLTKDVPLPSEPYRVEVESQKFDDLVKATPPPGDEISVRLEQERFDQMLAAQPPLDLAGFAGEGPPEPSASPEAASTMPPSSGAPSDPVSKTLAFLGIGGSGANQAPPVQAEGFPAPTFSPADVTGQTPPAMPTPSLGGIADAAGQIGTGIASGLDAVGGALGDAVGQVPGGEFAVDALRSQAQATTARRQQGMEAGGRVFDAYQGGTEPTQADQDAMFAEPVEMAMGLGGGGLGKVGKEAAGGLVDAAGNLLRQPKGGTAPILDAAGDVLKDVKVKGPPASPEVVAEIANWKPEKVGLFRKAFDRSRNVIASQGEAGQELARRVWQWREGAERQAADWVQRMPTVRKLKPDEMENLVDVLERGRVEKAAKAVPMNARVTQAAGEAKAVLDEVYVRAQNAGVGVAEKIENYFPHTFKQDILERIKDDKQKRAILDHFLESGQAADEVGAENLLQQHVDDVMERYKEAGRDRRHGGLEQERLANLPGYEKTKEALYRHLMTTSRRIHEVAQFGKDDAIANRLIAKVKTDGKDADTVRHMWKTIVEATPQDEGLAKLSQGIRAWNSATRLGWAAVSNITQGANTATVVGTLRTMQAAKKAVWSAADKEFADKTGATLDTVIREVRQGSGWSDRVPGVLGKGLEAVERKIGTNPLMPGFNEVEIFNRRLTAIAGRDYAIEMAAKGNAKELRKLHLDPQAIAARKGKLTEDEEITAARSIVERTQFKVDTQDLPAWASHPLGRIVAQFRTFGYSQTAFIGREVLAPLKEGDVRPLVRFLVLGTMTNAASTEMRNAIHGRPPEEDEGARLAQYVLGTTGEVGSLSRSAFGVNSKYVPTDRRAAMLMSSMLGPTAGLASDVAVSGMNAADYALSGGERGGFTPAARTAMRQVPLAGTRLINTFAPYKEKEPAPSSSYVLPSRSGRSNTRDGSR